jgi:paraquat-inducible protein B
MAEPTPQPELSEIPQALSQPKRRRSLPLIWVVPMVAVLVGGWLAVKTIREQGPTATVTFRSAEGLEAGKTKIKFKDVEIGVVKAITLSQDHSGVVVTAELKKEAEDFLVDDTRFWVVKPRIGGGGVSGLGTLLSGAYIGVDLGKSQQPRHEFKGLEVPPILTAGLPGREFRLHASDLGSISYGTPVFFRRLQVGEVVAYELDKDGRGVTVKIFVHAPYDAYVTTQTRFWHASGIDVALDANGIRVDTESVAAILLGGIAFGAPPDAQETQAAPIDAVFQLAPTRLEAFKRADTRVTDFVFVFKESVRGLPVGGPVDFRGITIGEVVSIGLDWNQRSGRADIPVLVRIFPDRLRSRVRAAYPFSAPEESRRNIDAFVAAGLRGQLRTGSLLTGQLYVALDFFPKAAKATVDWSKSPPELPTMPGGLQDLQDKLTSIADKLDRLPYDKIATDLELSLKTLDQALRSINQVTRKLDGELVPEVKLAIAQAKQTLAAAERTMTSVERTIDPDAALPTEMRETLREVKRTAESLRVLVDYLDRHPESLLRGKAAQRERK